MEKSLKKIGKEWFGGEQHRIYFDAKKYAGVKVNRYNTNYYSNKNFAVWYDCKTKDFGYRADGVEEDALRAVENIKAAVQG